MLYRDANATLDNIRAAVTTLEDAERITRREFGDGTVALFQGMAGNVTGLGVGCVRWANGKVTGTCQPIDALS